MVDQAKIRATLENATQTQQVYEPLQYEPEFYVKNDDPEAPRAIGGLDPEWESNYTPDVKIGPRGEELPQGAEAWTKDGLPYFGEGFAAYGNMLKWKWSPKTVSSEDRVKAAEGAKLYTEGFKEGDLGKIWSGYKQGWGSAFKALVGGKKDEETGEIEPTALTFVPRAVSVGLGSLLDVVTQAGRESKAQVVGRVQTDRELAEQSRLGGLGGEAFQQRKEEADAERARRLAPEKDDTDFERFSKDTTRWIYGFVRDFPLEPSNLWDKIRALEAPISSKDKKTIRDNNIQAAKIAATGWLDVAIKEEYIRRYEEGENPYLLAQELQNPIAEGVAEAIYDPLNFMGPVIAAVRGGKEVLKISTMVDDSSDLAKAVNAFGDVGANATDSGKLFGDIVDAKMAANAAVDGRVVVTQAARGISAHTATTKQSQIAATFGDWIGPLSTMMFKGEPGKLVFNTEKMGDVLRIAIGLASDTREEVLGAVASAQALEGVSMPFLMSDAGHVVGKTLRSILTNADGVVDATKIVDKMKDYENVDDVIKHMGDVVAKYGDELFPTIAERVGAAEKIKELTAAGKEVPERLTELTKMPLRADEKLFSWAERWKKTTQVKTIDTFYAHVYMGASPGYYMRNTFNNYLTAFVDDPKAIFQTEKMAEGTIDTLFGRIIEAAEAGIGAVGRKTGKPTIFSFAMHKAQKGEIIMSKRIVASSARDTFRRMAPRAMQEIEKIVDVPSTFDKGVWSKISSIWQSKNYNIVDTLDTLADAQKSQTYDVFKSMEWVDDAVRNRLGDIYDDVAGELAQVTTREEMLDVFKRKTQGVLDDAKLSQSDIANVDYKVPEGRGLGIEAMKDGSRVKIHDDVNSFAAQVTAANMAAETQLRETVLSILQEAAGTGNAAEMETVTAVFQKTVSDIIGVVEEMGGLTPSGQTNPRNAVKFFQGITNEFVDAWKARTDIIIKPQNVYKEAGTDVVGFWDNYIKPHIGTDYPTALSPDEAVNAYYNLVYYDKRAAHFAEARDTLAVSVGKLASNLLEEGINFDMNRMSKAVNSLDGPFGARQWDNAIVAGKYNGRQAFSIGVDGKNNYRRLEQLAQLNGLPPVQHKGKGQTFLKIINEYAEKIADGVPLRNTDELVHTYKNVEDIPSSVAEAAVQEFRKGSKDNPYRALAEEITDASKVADDVDWLAKGDKTPLNSSYHHSTDAGIPPWAAAEQTSKGIIDDLNKLQEDALSVFGKTDSYDAGFANKAEADKFYKALESQLEEKLLDIRSTAGEVARAKRNFALLDYDDRRNIDTLLAVVYPFHYWHSRTYVNWMKRVVQKPGILSAYAHYKDTLATIHSDQPEWWKYSINTNELLGMDAKNPLYFNLEATLNPLNGITGVDFNDPKRRVGFMSAALDDLGKMGPATWTPFSIAMAFALDIQGEEEAAARWGSQLFSQTKAATAILSMIEDGASFAGIEMEGLGEGATGGLLDRFMDPGAIAPLTSLFSGGIPPYVRSRIGRAMTAMQNEGFILDGKLITEEEFFDAARVQGDNPIWRAAYRRAINERAPGQVSSFIAGVGFKGRTESDMEIDEFYGQFYAFIMKQDELSQEEVRRGYDQLRQQYPFMDTLLLARKGGDERDQAYAYSVLSRIPPGSSEISEIAGMHPDIMNKFYETKGKFAEWPEDEQLGFMQSIVTLGSILEIPTNGTKQEWTEARNQMTTLRDAMEEKWGEEIHDEINMYYGIDDEEKDEWLVGHPAVEEALDWKANQIANAPESYAAAYYGGIDQIEKFYNNRMYREIDEKLPNMDEIWDEYGAIGDSRARKAYRNSHPEIQAYYDIRDKWDGFILKQMDELGSRLREGEPVQLRDTEDASIFAEDVQELVEAPPVVSQQEIMVAARRTGGDALIENIDYWQYRKRMSATTQAALEKVAEELGISISELLKTLK